nr:MAG TPA: hypothetical protein [Caudoviricetes sp.]
MILIVTVLSQIVNNEFTILWYYVDSEGKHTRCNPQEKRKNTMIDMNIICELIEKASNAGTAVKNSNGLHYDAVDHGDSTYICVYAAGEQEPFYTNYFKHS